MKKYLLAFLVLIAFGALAAQTVKIGYVDTDRLLYESNEAIEIQRLFNLDKQNWSSQLRSMDEEIRRMEQDYEIDKLTKNEAAKREALARIDAKKAEAGRLLNEYFGEGGTAEQRYRELIDPLTVKIQNLIVKIAQDEKYTMIFDTSYPTILYAAPSIDITDIVLLEINKDTIAPSAPKTESPKPGGDKALNSSAPQDKPTEPPVPGKH